MQLKCSDRFVSLKSTRVLFMYKHLVTATYVVSCMLLYVFSQQILIRKPKKRHVLCWSNFCVTLPRRARPCKITHTCKYILLYSVDMLLACRYRTPDTPLTRPTILSIITVSVSIFVLFTFLPSGFSGLSSKTTSCSNWKK